MNLHVHVVKQSYLYIAKKHYQISFFNNSETILNDQHATEVKHLSIFPPLQNKKSLRLFWSQPTFKLQFSLWLKLILILERWLANSMSYLIKLQFIFLSIHQPHLIEKISSMVQHVLTDWVVVKSSHFYGGLFIRPLSAGR